MLCDICQLAITFDILKQLFIVSLDKPE
jgi:hypothetical protein